MDFERSTADCARDLHDSVVLANFTFFQLGYPDLGHAFGCE
jgi:hypothetical protein